MSYEVRMRVEDKPLKTNNEYKFGLLRNIERAILLAQACQSDFLTFRITILFNVRFCALEDHLTKSFIVLQPLMH